MIYLENVLNMSGRNLCNTSSRRLEDFLQTFLQDVLKISWERFEDALKIYDQDEYILLDQDVLKTSWERPVKMYD